MTINEVIEDLTVIEALETVDGSEYCNNVKASTLKSAVNFLRKYRNLANMIITKENYYLQDREGTRKKIALALLKALKESVDYEYDPQIYRRYIDTDIESLKKVLNITYGKETKDNDNK